MPTHDLLARITGLIEKVRPHNSFAGRLARLTPIERQAYDRWNDEQARWSKQFKTPSDAYEALLSGRTGPQLSKKLHEKLHGKAPELSADATYEQVVEAYDVLRNAD